MSERSIKIFLIPTILSEGTHGHVLSPQIADTVRHLNVFFVENVRSARRFISSLKLGKVIDELEFIELNKDTPAEVTAENLRNLKEDAGVISEAGCPGVADPGAVAVGIAHKLDMQVVPLVGPSSILMALMASGMNGQSFAFLGYLPIDKALRKKAIITMERSVAAQTQIFMETPFRNNQLLETLLETCQPDTLLCIACNVTAPDELIRTLSVRNWKKQKPDLHKKPAIFILGQVF